VPTVRLSKRAEASYVRLARDDRSLFRRIDRALDRLASEPGSGKPLAGPLQVHRSHRVGPMRIIYRHETEAHLVLVLEISSRGGAYRGR
jgi:mRNA-degrading endonuclease RelE of RelBE toxin-antitoxin system